MILKKSQYVMSVVLLRMRYFVILYDDGLLENKKEAFIATKLFR